jgi:hypothetical protein
MERHKGSPLHVSGILRPAVLATRVQGLCNLWNCDLLLRSHCSPAKGVLFRPGQKLTKGEAMKSLRVAGIPALMVLCVAMALGQDAARDVDKGATKTGDIVKQAGNKVGHAAKSGVKGAVHGTKTVAKDSAKGVGDAGHGTKVVATDSAKGVKKASEKTGEGIKDATGKPVPSKPS